MSNTWNQLNNFWLFIYIPLSLPLPSPYASTSRRASPPLRAPHAPCALSPVQPLNSFSPRAPFLWPLSLLPLGPSLGLHPFAPQPSSLRCFLKSHPLLCIQTSTICIEWSFELGFKKECFKRWVEWSPRREQSFVTARWRKWKWGDEDEAMEVSWWRWKYWGCNEPLSIVPMS